MSRDLLSRESTRDWKSDFDSLAILRAGLYRKLGRTDLPKKLKGSRSQYGSFIVGDDRESDDIAEVDLSFADDWSFPRAVCLMHNLTMLFRNVLR